MATTYKALALFLSYPTADLQAVAPEAMTIIEAEGLVPARIVRALKSLADGFARADLYALQEDYVWLFDRTRSLSLHLYEHVHGESRERGQAMVALLELYRAKGLELSPGELPDYLPVFLEFLSILPEAEAASLLGEAAHVIAAIGERLHKRGSLYRAVFGALAALSAAPADRAALAALMARRSRRPSGARQALGRDPGDVRTGHPSPLRGGTDRATVRVGESGPAPQSGAGVTHPHPGPADRPSL
jgi:nitrate reductase delta subunit